jgi:hypothetical protein
MKVHHIRFVPRDLIKSAGDSPTKRIARSKADVAAIAMGFTSKLIARFPPREKPNPTRRGVTDMVRLTRTCRLKCPTGELSQGHTRSKGASRGQRGAVQPRIVGTRPKASRGTWGATVRVRVRKGQISLWQGTLSVKAGSVTYTSSAKVQIREPKGQIGDRR